MMNQETRSTDGESLPRILCVDDDIQVLRGIEGVLALNCSFDVETTTSANHALEVMRRDGPYMAIISDMSMSEMSGIELLSRVKLLSPDTVRILLTGRGNFETAISAVNEGHVFRFLTKPCPPRQLSDAVKSAVTQYRLITQDRQLMEQELAMRAEQIIRTERLATLGVLARGIGHEINNALTGIVGVTELMRDRLEQEKLPKPEHLNMLLEAAAVIKIHGVHLMNLGRPVTKKRETTDLTQIIEDTIAMLGVSGKTRGVPVVFEAPGAPLFVEVDPMKIQQALINVVINALDAFKGMEHPQPKISIWAEMNKDEGTVSCRIRDNACGISGDELERIFDAYYTTKSSEEGTGLGLVVVKEIIESFSGTVTVTSHVSSGTTFVFTLPGSVIHEPRRAAS